MGAGRQPLFDEVDRVDPTPSDHRESTFEFLNRIAGSYWVYPRVLMQEWLDHISGIADYNDLRQRLRSRDDEQFRSAFLELYLHESLLIAGYNVTVHPDVEGTGTHPDFLAERGDERLFIEAIAPGSNPKAKGSAKRRAALFDAVDRLDSPNFFLWLDNLVEGDSPPAGARLRADLRSWLATLDPDQEWDIEAAPTHHWQHDGWEVSFKAVPVQPEARGRGADRRTIGVYGHAEASWIDDAPAIRKALATKHREYGDLAAPFVIAVGTYIHDDDRWHTTNAMFGQLAVEISDGPGGALATREVRQPDGYFGRPPDWRHCNVSGVLTINQLMPYYVQRAEVTLWRHPDPDYSLPADLGLPCHTIEVVESRLEESPPGSTAEDFFGLPRPWPPGEPWPDPIDKKS